MAFLSPTRRRAIAWLFGISLVAFVGLQFIRPPLANPPVLADLQAPDQVKQILRTSCYNCHSNETKLPWFDQIVPAYWLVVSDVNSGREHMNFSNFNAMPVGQQRGFLYESVTQMQLGAMPPRKYTLIHPEAVVTPQQLTILKDYLNSTNITKTADAAQIAATDAEYQKWLLGGITAKDVKPSLNGVGFFYDYKNWKPVSTTDRYDNHTLRIILGNDVTIQAIADKNTHPWPDGAAFAKISMARQLDDQGHVQAGQFVQVEFMVKDAKKYADTEGWGFGRWKTTDLVPYGKTSSFANECASCHAPMHDNDFVYTMPIRPESPPTDVFNSTAALPDDLPYQPLQWKVITASVDHSSATMATLYGNDLAVTHARTSPQGPYPAGAVLCLVTWKQQEDAHWFGGNIPGQVQSIEFVSADASANANPTYSYQAYEGAPLEKTSGEDATVTQPRIDSILSARAAVLP